MQDPSPYDRADTVFVRALVPEHSVRFMETVSGGRHFLEGNFVFYAADDWLMGIGYPLVDSSLNSVLPGETSPGYEPLGDSRISENTAERFAASLEAALERTGAEHCWAIAPQLPARLSAYTENEDHYFVLPCNTIIPSRLRSQVEHASRILTVTENSTFTPGHRRLWAEFLARTTMRPNVRELYARTPHALAAACRAAQEGDTSLDLRLLSAWDASGNLVSSLLLDYSAKDFSSYIIGAHSREVYVPHASDLLFSVMLDHARKERKRYVHLGLGVNDGITRFKRKWGGREVFPYQMAAWKERNGRAVQSKKGVTTGKIGRSGRSDISRAMEALLSAPPGLSKQQLFDTFPKQRDFGMIREVRKGNAVSYLCGTAHFFCYSFEMAFRRLFDNLDTIIFEGPLDEDFLAAVEKSGRNPAPGSPTIHGMLNTRELQTLERVVYGPEGLLPALFGMQQKRRVDVKHLLASTRPWFAFFTLWVAFLERQGWSQSVDLEAYQTAKDMGKAVIGMENLEEQLDSLEVIPMERITDFLRRSPLWPSYMKRNIRAYLSGDLERMLGSSIEFPSRTEQVIDRRDERFRQRMRPFLEAGNCAVFVGSAHLLGLCPMLERDGFTVKPVARGLWGKLRTLVKN